MKNALKDQEAALAVERQEALNKQKAQMQGSLEQAQAEREDILQLYSKVAYCSVLECDILQRDAMLRDASGWHSV